MSNTKKKTSMCPFCQVPNTHIYLDFQTINYARTLVKLREVNPIKNVTTSKNSFKTNEIIRSLDCRRVLSIGNRLNP